MLLVQGMRGIICAYLLALVKHAVAHGPVVVASRTGICAANHASFPEGMDAWTSAQRHVLFDGRVEILI